MLEKESLYHFQHLPVRKHAWTLFCTWLATVLVSAVLDSMLLLDDVVDSILVLDVVLGSMLVLDVVLDSIFVLDVVLLVAAVLVS